MRERERESERNIERLMERVREMKRDGFGKIREYENNRESSWEGLVLRPF